MKNFLDLTPGSTAATDEAVKLYLPPTEAATVLAYLDGFQAAQPELEWSRVELQRLKAIGDKKAANMRGVRTAWIEAHIEDVIRCTKKSAFVGKPRCSWTSTLMRYYDRHSIKAPDIETVRRVVKEFNGF